MEVSNLDVEKKRGATVVGRGNSCGKRQQLWDDQDNHKLRPIIIVVLGFIGKKLIAEEPEEEEKRRKTRDFSSAIGRDR